MTLGAIFHKAADGGFWAEVPALPGCVSKGETFAEVESNLREAIELYLLMEEGKGVMPAEDRALEMTV